MAGAGMARRNLLLSSGARPISDNRATATSNDNVDDQISGPHGNLAATPDVIDPMKLGSTTATVAVQDDSINPVVTPMDTLDILIEVVGKGRQPKLRRFGRSHVHLLLFVNTTFYQEAIKLIDETFSVELYLPAGDCLPQLKLRGCAGLWRRHRKIRVYLLRCRSQSNTWGLRRALAKAWRRLRQKEVAPVGDDDSRPLFEVISYDADQNQTSLANELSFSTPRLLTEQQCFEHLLHSPVWAPVLTFDCQLKFVSAASRPPPSLPVVVPELFRQALSRTTAAAPEQLRHVLSRTTATPEFETELPELQHGNNNNNERELRGTARFSRWLPSFKRRDTDTRVTLSAALQLPTAPGQRLKFFQLQGKGVGLFWRLLGADEDLWPMC